MTTAPTTTGPRTPDPRTTDPRTTAPTTTDPTTTDPRTPDPRTTDPRTTDPTTTDPTTDGPGSSWRSRIPGSPWLLATCALSLLPLWTAVYPPMVDLAQHAAQVATWQRWGEPGFDYSAYFWVNWRTPYLVTNVLALLLSSWMPTAVAFKVVFSAAVVGLPLATLGLLRESGGAPSWAFLAVPAGYGFAFYMGFVAFAFAAPLALLFVTLSWRYAREPTSGRAWTLLLFSQVLFFTHTIAFGWAGLTGALLVVAHSPDLRSTLKRWWPYLAALALPAAWFAATWSKDGLEMARDGSPLFDPTRPLQMLSFTVGLPVHDLGLVLGAVLLALPFVAGGRPSGRWARWIPLLTAAAFFLLTPKFFFGTAYLHQRFAVFFLPCLLFALDPSKDASARRPAWILAAPALVWLAFVQVQCLAFRGETGAFGRLLDSMEPNRLVLYLPLDFRSEAIPYPVYLHFGSWYQVEKGGIVDYSFAELFPNRFRYRPEAEPQIESDGGWQPNRFDWHRHGGDRYDYFLVHSWRDPAPFFRQARAPVVPVASASGGWWLFAPRSPRTDPPRAVRREPTP